MNYFRLRIFLLKVLFQQPFPRGNDGRLSVNLGSDKFFYRALDGMNLPLVVYWGDFGNWITADRMIFKICCEWNYYVKSK